MKSTLFALAVTLQAKAGYSCTSRKSGSYTISSCSGSHGGSSHCTSDVARAPSRRWRDRHAAAEAIAPISETALIVLR